MRVYGFSGTRSTRVLWALEEASATYEYVQVNLKKGEGRSAAFLAINPGGKVPALVDGNLVLTESAAICIHVADKFPAAKLAGPLGSPQRAKLYQWAFFALSELEQPLWTIAKHTFALPEAQRVPAIFDTARWEFARALKVLAAGLADREYIADDNFTVADVLVANSLAWARMQSIDLVHSAINSYADRMLARSALAKAVDRERSA